MNSNQVGQCGHDTKGLKVPSKTIQTTESTE